MDNQWGIFTDNDTGDIAVCPLNDKHVHDAFDKKCECKPTVQVEGAVLLYIHHAWDFREIFEPDNEDCIL